MSFNQFLGLVLLVCLGAAIYDYRFKEVSRPPGILVSEQPSQVDYREKKPALIFADYQIQPLAQYKIRARLISSSRYFFDDGAKVAPIDFCLGWEEMSDSKNLDRLEFEQTTRFCFFRYSVPPVDLEIINNKIANMHLIPADSHVKKLLTSARKGQIVELSGDLVRVDYKGGGAWMSSMVRTDRGKGACELMYVKNVKFY